MTILGTGALTYVGAQEQIPLTATNCIVWGNSGGSLVVRGLDPVVTYSCVEGADVLPGEGSTICRVFDYCVARARRSGRRPARGAGRTEHLGHYPLGTSLRDRPRASATPLP